MQLIKCTSETELTKITDHYLRAKEAERLSSGVAKLPGYHSALYADSLSQKEEEEEDGTFV